QAALLHPPEGLLAGATAVVGQHQGRLGILHAPLLAEATATRRRRMAWPAGAPRGSPHPALHRGVGADPGLWIRLRQPRVQVGDVREAAPPEGGVGGPDDEAVGLGMGEAAVAPELPREAHGPRRTGGLTEEHQIA